MSNQCHIQTAEASKAHPEIFIGSQPCESFSLKTGQISINIINLYILTGTLRPHLFFLFSFLFCFFLIYYLLFCPYKVSIHGTNV